MDSNKIKSCKVLDTYKSEYNLDCVSFCKVKGYEHLLLCAKYELLEDQTYKGGIMIFDTTNK